MARKFGMVGSSVWDSDKFTSLSDDSARLTYLYLCTTHHGNGVGVFKMPAAYLAVDRGKTKDEADATLQELKTKGLIEIGHEGQIRITKWFYGPSGANSPSTGSSFAKTFQDRTMVKDGELRLRAALEMMHSTLEKARGWNPDSTPLSHMHGDFIKLLSALLKDHGVKVFDAVEYLGYSTQDTMWDTMWDTVLHTMSNTMWTHRHRQGHLTPDKEKDTDSDTESDTEREIGPRARNRATPSSPPTSPPANGGRSGGSKVPDDIQGKIDSLGSSMCEPCQTKIGYGDCPDCKAEKDKSK